MDVVTIQRALRDLIADGLGAESERGLRVQLHGVTVELQVKMERVELELPDTRTEG